VSPLFAERYTRTGRPSIPPERLLRALLLEILFSVPSERQLMEALAYDLLYRWFVGLGMDDAVGVPTTFTENRDRLLGGDVERAFFDAVLAQSAAPARDPEARSSLKSLFKPTRTASRSRSSATSWY
jgi:transposase